MVFALPGFFSIRRLPATTTDSFLRQSRALPDRRRCPCIVSDRPPSLYAASGFALCPVDDATRIRTIRQPASVPPVNIPFMISHFSRPSLLSLNVFLSLQCVSFVGFYGISAVRKGREINPLRAPRVMPTPMTSRVTAEPFAESSKPPRPMARG